MAAIAFPARWGTRGVHKKCTFFFGVPGIDPRFSWRRQSAEVFPSILRQRRALAVGTAGRAIPPVSANIGSQGIDGAAVAVCPRLSRIWFPAEIRQTDVYQVEAIHLHRGVAGSGFIAVHKGCNLFLRMSLKKIRVVKDLLFADFGAQQVCERNFYTISLIRS
jgi:hypothetical protein